MAFQPTYDFSSKINGNCYAQGRGDLAPVLLVCHSTAGPGDDNSITDPVVALARSNASANYLCNNDRQVSVQWLIGAEAAGAPTYRIVPEGDTAYHAGGMPGYPSSWTDPATNTRYTGVYAPLDCSIINVMSIGIEIFGQVNDMLGPNQRKAVTALVQDIVSRYPVMAKPGHIVSHASLEADRQDGRNWVALAGAAASQYTATKTPMPPVPLPPLTLNGHTLQHGFKDYWTANGSVTAFGLPITEEMQENALVVQYFERARLEYNPVTKLITRGLVGTEAYNAKYPATPTPLVPPGAKP